jgi:hypothetical protein
VIRWDGSSDAVVLALMQVLPSEGEARGQGLSAFLSKDFTLRGGAPGLEVQDVMLEEPEARVVHGDNPNGTVRRRSFTSTRRQP